ncbi:ABC transporter permease subunit [Paenibacillus chitinolyticus]|uniref:ABC transporter permease subunit n=1 Tax=Paenibacillus chitinolyticus TaxID=79263 RepID=UPI0035592CA5
MSVNVEQADTRRRDTWAAALLPWLLPVLIVAGWHVAAVYGPVSQRLFPPPLEVAKSGWKLFASGQLTYHLGVSLGRAAAGFVIGGGIGLLLGAANGLFVTSYRIFDTSIQMIRNIPHLALVPLVILWMGIDEGAKVFLVALGVLFPVYVNTFHGIRSVDRGYLEMGRVYGLTSWQLFRHVILPGALPSVFVGIRYGLGIMWLTLIVAETIATDKGIGFLALNAREFMQADIIILSILLYALLGKLADVIAKWLEHTVLKWNVSYRKA